MFMWSASASDSSIVTGPTSRRTRPRLSRRRVRSRGSSGSSVASRSTSTAASLFSWGAAKSLRARPAALLLEPFFARRCAGLRRHALSRDRERLPELLHEPVGRQFAVAELAALVLCHRAQHLSRPRDDPPFLRVGERRRRLDVEHGLDARLRFLRVLTTRPARARDAELDLREREEHGTRHPDRLPVHVRRLPVPTENWSRASRS